MNPIEKRKEKRNNKFLLQIRKKCELAKKAMVDMFFLNKW